MNRIKQLREDFGYTQQELADRINGAKSTVAMYENETRKPSLEILVKLSEIFDCSIDYLLCKTDIKKINNENIITDDTNEIRAIARDVAKLKPEKKELFKNLLKQMSDEANEANKK